jgi:Rap guanine nucleotide exchange factor 2
MNCFTHREAVGDEVLYGSTTGLADSKSATQSGAVVSALTGSSVNQMYMNHSNPDLTSICYDDPRADYPEHALKVFKADQSSKYLLIHKVKHCNSFDFFDPSI